jgi:hypothetical protein
MFDKLKTLLLNECLAIDLVRILQCCPVLEMLTLQLSNAEVCPSYIKCCIIKEFSSTFYYLTECCVSYSYSLEQQETKKL